MRTGGAHLLASRGVNPFKIQAMGRWRSPLVVHYAGEAMATGLVGDMRSSTTAAAPMPGLSEFLARLDRRISSLEGPMAPASSAEAPAICDTEPPPDDVTDPIVMNRDTGVYHRTRVSAQAPPQLQRSQCGWAFSTRRFTRFSSVPDGTVYTKICDRCLPVERSISQGSMLSDIE